MSGADVRYGDGSGHPMTGRWMPDLPLRTETGSTRVAELLRGGRPLLLTTTGGTTTGGTAKAWTGRVDVIVTPDAPAETVLVRPDGYVAWAGTDGDGLENALRTWFGAPA
jgi:hypothetical protein